MSRTRRRRSSPRTAVARSLCVLVPPTLGAVALIAVPGQATAAAPGRPDLIAFTRAADVRGAGDIWVIRANGTGVRRLTRTGDNADAAWSPDGKLLAFTSRRSGNQDIYIMGADGRGLRRVTTRASAELDPTWSPDGSQLDFVSDRTGPYNIFRISSTVPYGQPVQITHAGDGASPHFCPEGEHYSDPAWHPRAAILLVSRWCEDGLHQPVGVIERISASDGRVIDDRVGIGVDADWAPHARKVAFANGSNEYTSYWITKANPDGSQPVDLALTSSSPVWSPDGSSIAFSGVTEAGRGLHVMKADGTNQRFVIDGIPTSWRPLR
jgi:Tol biopolymer transport system component